MPKIKLIYIIQAVYFTVTAAWPLISMDTFMKVTGYKTDTWLVDSVSLLTFGIAFTLFLSIFRKENPVSVHFLSLLSSAGFITIDVYFVLKHVIEEIYFSGCRH